MKVLIDTNVLLSAALRDRLPEQVVLHLATHDDWLWLVTAEILDEYVNVLARPKFKLPPEIREQWTALVNSRTICVSSPPAIDYPRDPKDGPFLAAAIATAADHLVTGDRDLFAAQSFVPTRIVSVAEMAQILAIVSG